MAPILIFLFTADSQPPADYWPIIKFNAKVGTDSQGDNSFPLSWLVPDSVEWGTQKAGETSDAYNDESNEGRYQAYLHDFKQTYGISNIKLSEITGVSRSTLSQWCNGRLTPDLRMWFTAVNKINAWKKENPYNYLDHCGEILDQLRIQYNLKQRELIEITGIAASTLYHWKSGESAPSYDLWNDIIDRIVAWEKNRKEGEDE